jgi:peptidoglycan/LPS O-acetylase OafA/YrhL
MRIELNAAVVAVLLIGGVALLAAAEILLHYVWNRLTRRRTRRTGGYPWSERTGL